jgi:putative ABC transport system ATP-binding protein
MELLKQLNREHKITVVMVTHESDMAAYSDRIIQFVDGQVADVEAGHAPAVKGVQDR